MNIPILLIVFNRFEQTVRVFEEIKKIRPKKLYIAADGPRCNFLEDKFKTQIVQDYIIKNIDWDCELKTLFREENVGCKKAVSEAITWMFEFEENGIILEDDCLPNSDFFYFCEEMLLKYKDNLSIGVVTGNNFQDGIKRGEQSYYFSKYNHVWGWATWKRAWNLYSNNIYFLDEWLKTNDWKIINCNYFERRYWKRIFNKVNSGEISTAWDYPWTACLWYHKMLTVTPNVNLVSNIGFGNDSTHTHDTNSPFNNIPCESIGNIKHPEIIIRNIDADKYVYNKVFGGNKFRFPAIFLTLTKYLYSFLKLKKES